MKKLTIRKINIIILIISILIRIPTHKQVLGSDTFLFIWMGKALQQIIFNSSKNTWLISFFSYFGMYPYSHYPIGIPFLLSIFFYLGFSIELSSFIITIIITIIAYYGCVKLSKIIFISIKYRELFLLFYLNSPLFYRYSYFTIHSRGMILCFLPWVILFSINIMNKKSKKEKQKSILLLLLIYFFMIFSHRLWIPTLIFPFFFILFPILLNRIKKLRRKEKLVYFLKKRRISILIITIIVLILCFFIGRNIFFIDEDKISSPIFSNEKLYGLIFNLGLDYINRIGIAIFFVLFGIIKIYSFLNENMKKLNSRKNSDLKGVFYYISLFIFLYPLSFTLVYSLYSTIIFYPLIIILAIEGISFLYKKLKIFKLQQILIFNLFTSTIFTILYFMIQKLHFSAKISLLIFLWNTITFLLIIKYFIQNKKKKIRSKDMKITLILINISLFYSISVLEGNYLESRLEFPYNHISEDEIVIKNILQDLHYDGIIYSYNVEISKHMLSYGFIPSIYGNQKGSMLFYNIISKESIKSNTYFSLNEILSLEIFKFNKSNPEKKIFEQLNSLNASNPEHVRILKNLGVKFGIALYQNNSIYPFYQYGKNFYQSNLLETSYKNKILFKGKYLCLIQLY